MKKRILAFLVACAMVLSNIAFADTVNGSGSSALAPIINQAAAEFSKLNKGIKINYNAAGSGTGITQVKSDVVQFGCSDYAVDDSTLFDNPIAVIPFVFFTNKNVTCKDLTKKQISDILTGKITNWKDVGGKDQAIKVISRSSSSGTRVTVESMVLDGGKVTDKAVQAANSKAMLTTVKNTPGAVGFIDLAYIDKDVKALKYEDVEPTIENAKSGKYKLLAVGHFYTKGQPTGVVKEFLDYIKAGAFQNRVVKGLKFIPVNEEVIKQIKVINKN